MPLSQIPSIAQIPGLQAALDAKAALASPTFTGRITQNAGTETSASPLLAITATYQNPNLRYTALQLAVTRALVTNPTSDLLLFTVDGVPNCYIRENGTGYFRGGLATEDAIAAFMGSLAASRPVLDLGQTWNNPAENFVGEVTDITDTASGAGSLLRDWRVGGVSKAKISKSGRITVADGLQNTIGGGGLGLGTSPGSYNQILSAGDIELRSNAGDAVILDNTASTGGVLHIKPRTSAPAAPAAGCRLFAQADGGGKMQLLAVFPTGAVQLVAIEP